MSSKSKKGDQGRSSEPKDASKERLPFEPAAHRKKTPKKTAPAPVASNKDEIEDKPKKAASTPKQATAIPDAVSRRMVRRVAFFSGIPTSLGMLTFIVSYFIVTRHWLNLPHIAVVLVSMGFFGLGVLGLSYGALSASWDENRLGSWHGWSEFTTNFGRLTNSWRALRQRPDA